jgi:UPF0042 nucleotide-binding protein
MTEVLIVTGMAGAGKTNVLKTLEDLGWETVDNIPLSLLGRVVIAPTGGGSEPERPIAVGLGTGTRDFDPEAVIRHVEHLRTRAGVSAEILFLDCSGSELARRYVETRRRHPLATDRPAAEGIAQERTLLAPLRAAADRLIDTTRMRPNALAQQIREAFVREAQGETTLTVESFGFSRGVPTGADLVFDMRFLRNPHWDPALRPLTGRDARVGAYIAADPAYDEAVGRIEELLLLLLPRYHAEGKPYVTVAFGCTGGKHRSVHVAERVAGRLRDGGFSPTIRHRDLGAEPQDAPGERTPGQ